MRSKKSLDGFMSVSEYAKYLKISVGRVHQLIREKRLKAKKIGYYYLIEIGEDPRKDHGRPKSTK